MAGIGDLSRSTRVRDGQVIEQRCSQAVELMLAPSAPL